MLNLQRCSELGKTLVEAMKEDENIKSVVTADKLLFHRTISFEITRLGHYLVSFKTLKGRFEKMSMPFGLQHSAPKRPRLSRSGRRTRISSNNLGVLATLCVHQPGNTKAYFLSRCVMPMPSFCLRRTCIALFHGSRKGCHTRSDNLILVLNVLGITHSIVWSVLMNRL